MTAQSRWWVLFRRRCGLRAPRRRALLLRARDALPSDRDTDQSHTGRLAAGRAEVVLETSNGEKLVPWHVPARNRKPVVIYFHRNAEIVP